MAKVLVGLNGRASFPSGAFKINGWAFNQEAAEIDTTGSSDAQGRFDIGVPKATATINGYATSAVGAGGSSSPAVGSTGTCWLSNDGFCISGSAAIRSLEYDGGDQESPVGANSTLRFVGDVTLKGG